MRNDTNKDELQSFIEEQKASSPGFAEGFEEGYRNFRIGVMLKETRLNAGMSQVEVEVEVAQKLITYKLAISDLFYYNCLLFIYEINLSNIIQLSRSTSS
jgi:hypothetical protein